MNKQEFLVTVSRAAAENIANEEEVIGAYQAGKANPAVSDTSHENNNKLVKILYYIGGLIVFLGAVIFVSQNWISLGSIARILVTLGTAIAAYLIAVLFLSDKRTESISFAFFLIYALLLPVGIFVSFYQGGLNISTSAVNAIMAVIVLIAHLISYLLFRKKVFLFGSVVFGTWLFFSLTNLLVGGAGASLEFYEYRVLFVGLSYLLLGYYFATFVRTLSSWMYTLGSLGFLGAALALGNWSPHQNMFWEIIFPALVIGIIYLSIYFKHRSFLVIGTLYLVAYISKITGEYFADSMSWPVALIFIGLAIIAVAFGAFYLNKKYLSLPEKTL